MQNVYFSHSTSFDYYAEFYKPILESGLKLEHNLIFPHLQNKEYFLTKERLKSINIVFAECSCASTGSGIELGWADFLEIPIFCLIKEGVKYSSSLHSLQNCTIVNYNETNLVNKIQDCLLFDR